MSSSFGVSRPQRGVRPAPGADCPCGGATFDTCCGPILGGEPAATAEALMRSRFTAFVLGDAAHLLDTWHPSTRPASLELDAQLTWTGLDIDDTTGGGPGDRRGTVTFRAHWHDARTGERGVLSERSRFVFQKERWSYLDGDVD